MKVKLCMASAVLRFYPIELAIEKIAEAGYDALELWGGQYHGYYQDFLAAGSNLEERRLDHEKIGEVKAIAEDHALDIVMYTPEQVFYPINYLARDVAPFEGDKERNKSKNYFRLSVDVSKALGANKILVTTPFWKWRKKGGRYEMIPKKELIQEAKEVLKELSAYAKEKDVTLVLEPLSHLETTAVETLDETLWVLKEVNSPNLKAMIDTGHVNVIARRIGKKPSAYMVEHVKKLGENLVHVHIDDNLGEADDHLVPGDGNIDFKPFARALKESGYKGYVSVEIAVFGHYAIPPEPERLIKRSRRFVLELFRKVK